MTNDFNYVEFAKGLATECVSNMSDDISAEDKDYFYSKINDYTRTAAVQIMGNYPDAVLDNVLKLIKYIMTNMCNVGLRILHSEFPKDYYDAFFSKVVYAGFLTAIDVIENKRAVNEKTEKTIETEINKCFRKEIAQLAFYKRLDSEIAKKIINDESAYQKLINEVKTESNTAQEDYDAAFYKKYNELSDMISENPADAIAYCKRASAQMHHGDSVLKVIEDASKAIELKPDLKEAYVIRAVSYDFAGEFDKAEKDYLKLLELNVDWDIYEQYIQHLLTYGNNEFDKAEKLIDNMFDLVPETATMYVARGALYQLSAAFRKRRGKDRYLEVADKAVENYVKAKELDPGLENWMDNAIAELRQILKV